MATHINPQDLRVRRTRKHLQQAFIMLITEKDFQDVTIQDIADRAEVNRATFYKHFQDKFELLDVTVANVFTEARSGWLADDAIMNEDTMKMLIRFVFQWHQGDHRCEPYPRTYAALVETIAKAELCRYIHRLFQQTPSTAHQLASTLEMSATLIGWALYGITQRWSHTTESIDALIDKALPLLMTNVTHLQSRES